MVKIKINSSLKTDEDNVLGEFLGTFDNNIIVYQENNINVTLLIKDNKIKMSRIADDYDIELDFALDQIAKGIYDIKKHKIKMDLEVKTNILEINNNKIFIEYELKLNDENMGIFSFEIKYEVIQWI